jgi:hypothetical protein
MTPADPNLSLVVAFVGWIVVIAMICLWSEEGHER